MAEIDKLDRMVGFRPFYDVESTQRLLQAYQARPHLYNPSLVSQLKDHAAYHNIPFEEVEHLTADDRRFKLLRAVRQTGEGFLSGFSTFNVGEPSQNPYERIARSVGQLAGFVGYIPSAPFKAMKAFQLAEAAQALRGKSIPMLVAGQATKKASPIVSDILKKTADSKNSAFRDAAKFLTDTSRGGVPGHVAEGAFHLGVASSVSAWQLGALEMLKAGTHGAVTGGVFRGVANVINKGGIPKLDQATGKMVLDATQKQDQILRMGAMSLYEGMASKYRGETTPEQIYSFLLGAFFGAHETTAGQMRSMKFVQKVEKEAAGVNAKELKRLNKDGKPFDWDTAVYDPRLVKGWDNLPKDVQESVMHTILTRHGTYGKQALMATETLEGAMLEPKIEQLNKIMDADQAVNQAQGRLRESMIAERAEQYKGQLEVVEKITPQMIKESKGEKVFLKKQSFKEFTDENFTQNAKAIKEAVESLPLDKKVVVDKEGWGANLQETAPKTWKYMQDTLFKWATGREKAIKKMQEERILVDEKLDDYDIGGAPEADLAKRTVQFVHKYFDNSIQKLAPLDRPNFINKSKIKISDILVKHFKPYKGTINSEKFIKDIEKAFPKEPALSIDAKKDLRQLLIRQNQTEAVPLMSLHATNVKNKNGKWAKNYNTEFELIGLQEDGKTIVETNLAGNNKLIMDSKKAIEYAAENAGVEGRAYMVWDSITTAGPRGKKEVPLKDLGKKETYRGYAGFKKSEAEKQGRRIIAQGIQHAADRGYYYWGGKGDSGKMYFFKWHPSLGPATPIAPTVRRSLNIFKEKDPDVFVHYQRAKDEFVAKYGKNLKESGKYFDRAFLSNLLWDKDLYALGDKGWVEWLRDNSSIKDSKGFNKRSQIWLTDGFELDPVEFKRNYEKRGLNLSKSKAKGQLSLFDKKDEVVFRLIRDAENTGLTIKDKATLYTESTDGKILVEENFIDALNDTYGLPDSGQNKSFIVGKNKKHGAILGKFMFHKASAKASEHMRKEGVHFYMFDSAAKERGNRQFGELKVDDNLNATFKGENYTMKLSDIKGSLSEKQTDHMLQAQQVPKQLMANLVTHADNPIARELIKDFFDNVVESKFIGEKSWNDRFAQALNKKAKDLTAMEMNDFLDNIDKISLHDVIEALKSTEHPEFVSRLYQKVLKKNIDDLTMDYQSGDVSRSEYESQLAQSRNITSGVNRMMEIWPDVSIFLHKDVRNYMQSAMRSFVVNRVIRPKWDHSISVRMRGLDPWLAKESGLKDLNLADNAKNKKYLKEKYGVERSDELFFLDNRFKKTKWDMSDYISGKGKLTLEEVWDKYIWDSRPGKNKIRDDVDPRLIEFMKTISLRVPMDSISGAHKLMLGGFTNIDGHGAVFHPRTMQALGGADLDGDKAFVMFGMKPEWKDMYHSNKYEFFNEKTNSISDNKGAPVPEKAYKIIEDALKDTPHDKNVLQKIKDKKLTYRDLLALTNDGTPEDIAYKTSAIGKYTPETRETAAMLAVEGRDHLGPAASSKQVLNATYDGMLKENMDIQRYYNKDTDKFMSKLQYDNLLKKKSKKIKGFKADYREKIKFYDYSTKKEHTIYVEPRKDVEYSRELLRAEIAFGSDPLDELGLAGPDYFFNHAWHSLFKVDWRGDMAAKKAFTPNSHARGGLFKIYSDFNKAYFSRDFANNRRFYASEIQEMSDGIHKLNDRQKNTMLPRMVDILKDENYSDNILTRIDSELLKGRYKAHGENALELAKLNVIADVPGGLLGRDTFASKSNPLAMHALESNISSPTERITYHKNIKSYKELFDTDIIKKSGSRIFGGKDFWRKSDPASNWNLYKKFGEDAADVFYREFYNSESFRRQQVDKLYRQASDSIQNDAMDRVSATQLIKALEMNKHTDKALIVKMSKAIEDIKRIEHAKRMSQMHDEIIKIQNLKLTKKNKDLLNKFFDTKYVKGFHIDFLINKRIQEFKQNNYHKNGEPLNASESYLFDTMMLSTFYRGKDLSKTFAYENMPKNMKKILNPYISELKRGNSGTYFEKGVLKSPWINDNAIKDFFQAYSKEFEDVLPSKRKQLDLNKILEEPSTEKKIEKAEPVAWETEWHGLKPMRDKAVANLNNVERGMIDELVSHLEYYHKSLEDGGALNKLARGVRRKNLDAFTIEDYRVFNNFFRDMRAGNIFIKPGKLTKDNIPILSKRHHMLFPKQVSEELMIKDFQLFEQEGLFQNFNGEWKRGIVGRPVQVIEHVQFAIGTAQDTATKVVEDQQNIFDDKLRNETGYDGIKDGLGHSFFEVATAIRDLRNIKNQKDTLSPEAYRQETIKAVDNLKEAKERANWSKNQRSEFNVTTAKGQERLKGRDIVERIDKVLSQRSIETYKWIRGAHWDWDGSKWVEVSENPLMQFVKTKDGKIQYWDVDKFNTLHISQRNPIIDVEKFTTYVVNNMKKGKPIDISLGLDNLRKISRSIQIESAIKQRDRIKDQEMIDHYNIMIESLKHQKIDNTHYLKPDSYHPHFVANKSLAKESIVKAIEDINKLDPKVYSSEYRDKEIAKLINQYRQMTGNWITQDIIDNEMIDGALKEIAEKRRGPHLDWFAGDPVAANMHSRSQNLAGWARDVGAWHVYQKNLIDTFYRQIGQVASKKILTDFESQAMKQWEDPGQVMAWNNYVSDYISRSLGHPTKIPQEWMEGKVGKLMNIKGTPYSWFADNHVKDMINKVKKKLGFKEDLRLPEELRGIDEMDLRHWSNMEAKYQLATLLAHPKSAVANIFGGTMHTIQSVGWRTWKNARNVKYLRDTIGGEEAGSWKSMEDLNKWVIKHGVIPDFIRYEADLNPSFRGGKFKDFLEDAKRVIDKDPRVKDQTLRDIAKKHKITDSMFDKAAWFMREPERMLRRDAFIAHYLQARELYGGSNMELNHPLLIEMAKKGVKATQFLYSAPFRPAFSTTALGKVMTRFQTWAWNSVRFRNDVFKQAKIYGFREGTSEFERFKRQYLTDMFVFALGNVFAYSIFESAMPAPYNWFQDTADWIFGDEKERDRAFFGQWPTALAPLQVITPPGLRLAPATFSAISNNDFSRIADYHMWTMFPFGRMARDLKGVMENPMRTIEKGTGIPYQQFAREATKYKVKNEEEDQSTED